MATVIPSEEVERVAAGLTKAQRECGDVIDRFPCAACGAASPSDCTVLIDLRRRASALVNETRGLGNRLRTYLERTAK